MRKYISVLALDIKNTIFKVLAAGGYIERWIGGFLGR